MARNKSQCSRPKRLAGGLGLALGLLCLQAVAIDPSGAARRSPPRATQPATHAASSPASCPASQAATQGAKIELAKPKGDTYVRIWNFHGAEGYTEVYDFTPKELVITGLSCYEGVANKELFRMELKPEHVRALGDALGRLPLGRLKDNYENPNVMDGFQITFEFHSPKQKDRKIAIYNKDQDDLANLVLKINEIIPKKYTLPTCWSR